MNPDVFAGPARRLTPEEWAEKAFGEGRRLATAAERQACQRQASDEGLSPIHRQFYQRVEELLNEQGLTMWEFERRAQGGRG
jgi:hypothetical protein